MLRLFITGIISLLLIVNCGSKKGLLGTEAYIQIKPVKPLELDETEMPVNLKIFAFNVADESSSYKNRFQLYINGNLINPNNKIDNTTKNYTYELKLIPGYYEVKGVYLWHDGWNEAKSEIKTKELIRLDDKGLTTLEKDIPKDWRGIVRTKKLFFDVSYEPFSATEEEDLYQKGLKALEAKIDSIAALRFADDQIRDSLAGLASAQGNTKIQIQINTDPMKCQIYIDDKLVGVSPISWWLDRNSSHVIQAQHENYRTGIRLVNKEEMNNQEKLIIIQRLEPLPGISQEPEEQNKATESPADSTISSININNVDEKRDSNDQ